MGEDGARGKDWLIGHGGITCVLQTQFSSFLYFYLWKKIRLDVSCESSARGIVCLAEDSHEISSLIFSEKQ